jgi:hypothetical protein
MINKNDLIVPIRTRGAIRAREAIRTRGAVQVRGTSSGGRPHTAKPVTFPVLLATLRKEAKDLPLSIVVYGWGGKPAEEFVSKLRPHLGPEDAMVLLPSRQEKPATAVPEGAVLLNMNRPSHKRVYKNGHLNGDIVFLGEPVGKSEIETWKGSARAVIVKEGQPKAETDLKAARKIGLCGYHWSGDYLRKD